MEETMAVKLRKLSYPLGAEVCDVDVAKPMSEQSFGEIYRAFLDNGILLFRNQDITREQHIEFSRRFGELDRHESLPRDRHPQYPELLMVTNEPKTDGSPSDTKYTGRQWHSDMSFTTEPSLGSLLKSYEVPEVGGDTLFANMYMAYDALSGGMKKLIANLHGIHMSGTRKLANDNTGIDRMQEQKKINPPVAQPVVRVHPETGRKALYIGEKVKRFDGMTDDESRPLIDYLVRHATKPEFVYRHQWRKNDIVVWDNRCTMHQALGDFDETQLRHLERTTVLGTPSGYVVANA
jgi:taurine dioxygenase